jgi:leader peptidase (prepilin peptidase)/N-methyltransferase
MDILILLESNHPILIMIVGVFSLLIGSFLNAVIYRIPLMLKRAWKRDCQTILEKTSSHIDDGQIKYVDTKQEEIERIKNLSETVEGN